MEQNKKIAAFLTKELVKRQKKNPLYSLRSFANHLKIGASTLSEYLNAKNIPSEKMLKKILLALDVSPAKERGLLLARSGQINKRTLAKDKKVILAEDSFSLIAHWAHYAILSLCKLPEHKASPEWVGKRLGITKFEAKDAMERLIRLGLIQIKRGKIVRVPNPIFSTQDVPSRAIRKRHKQFLELASVSLDRDPVDKRFFFGVTMAINPKNLEKVKKDLQKMSLKASRDLEKGKVSEVYQLSLCLFPLGLCQS